MGINYIAKPYFLLTLEGFFFSKKKGSLKGQFYIIGALIITLLMFSAKYASTLTIEEPVDFSKYVFENIINECPRAVNTIYANGQNSGYMEYNLTIFLDYARNISQGHNRNMDIVSVVMIPTGSDYNVSIGNFVGENITINITVGATTQSSSNLADKTFDRKIFANPYGNAVVNVTYNTSASISTGSFSINNTKVHAYFEVKMFSDNSVWKNTIAG